MYFWINFFLWNFLSFVTFFIFSFVLEPRWEKIPRLIWPFLFTLIEIPFAYIKITNTVSRNLKFEISTDIIVIIVLLFFAIPYKNKIWQKLLLGTMYIIMAIITEQILYIVGKYQKLSYDFTFKTVEMTIVLSYYVIIMLMLNVIFLLLWNRIVYKKTSLKTPWLFFVFPISQYAYIGSANALSMVKSDKIQSNFGIIIGFIADLILLYVLVEQSNKEETEKQLQELHYKQQIEAVHYQAIESRRTDMAKIRHDVNNQLTAAYHLNAQGNVTQSNEILNKLNEYVIGTNEYVYCGNSVINAVLNEKERICKEQGIKFDFDIAIGDEPKLEPIHICSIFSNLIDNAIKAVATCKEDNRFISIKAKRIEDYIHIKVENASLEPTKLKPDLRKHYGQEILRDIAQQYNGEFRTEWNDGVYKAMLSLTIPE